MEVVNVQSCHKSASSSGILLPGRLGMAGITTSDRILPLPSRTIVPLRTGNENHVVFLEVISNTNVAGSDDAAQGPE